MRPGAPSAAGPTGSAAKMTDPVLDAAAVAQLLDMSPQRFMALFKRGLIHQRVERGIGDDDGRFRITLSHLGRRIVVVVSADGTILERSDASERPQNHRDPCSNAKTVPTAGRIVRIHL